MKIINEEEYKSEVLKSKGLAMVDFFATWCAPCKMYSPVLEEVEEETKVPFYKMDVDQCLIIPRDFGVMSIPTLCIFKDGKFMEKVVGYRHKDEVIEYLQKYM